MSKNQNPTSCLIWAVGALIAFLALIIFGPLLNLRRGGGPIPLEKAAVRQIHVALRQYYVEFGAAPAGDPRQVLAALRGQNPRQIVFFEYSNRYSNTKGELIDRWDTPYRFDLSDPEKPRIWSCGKDRRDDGGAEGSDDITSWR